MSKRAFLALAFVTTLVVSGCSSSDVGSPVTPPGTSSGSQVEADADLERLDARELIDYLDRLDIADRPEGMMASVRPHEVVVTAGADERVLPMPEDSFYVSVAPYVDQTHDCFFHSLTTCQGELTHEDVHVTITDSATGERLVDEQVTTNSNGFTGFWLPRDVLGTIVITHEGLSVTSSIGTDSESATCLTNLALA